MKARASNKLQQMKEVKAHEDGFYFALLITAVALNNVYGFGDARLHKLEGEITRILNDEFGNDLDAATIGLKRRIKQIRNIEVFKELEEVYDKM